jgi:hypothetical protein
MNPMGMKANARFASLLNDPFGNESEKVWRKLAKRCERLHPDGTLAIFGKDPLTLTFRVFKNLEYACSYCRDEIECLTSN